MTRTGTAITTTGKNSTPVAGDKDLIDTFIHSCTDCRACLGACSLLEQTELTPSEIATLLRAGERINYNLKEIILRCSLCGLCSQSCPMGLNPAELIRLARRQLMVQGQLDPDDYRLLQVDRKWHLFSIYQQAYGIDFSDLQSATCDALFFPGCTLSSYAPELTRSVHGWLRKQGMNVGIVTQCCGVPLTSIGLEEDNQTLCAELRKTLSASGATRLITACPNCYYHLQNGCEGIEVVSLYQLLLEAGIRIAGPARITVHDSCMDRFSGELGRIIRELACGYPLVEMSHHGKETICCGAGGNVSLIDPDLSDARARTRVKEFHQTTATYCVTSCMGCTRRLVSVNNKASHQNGRQHSLRANGIVHILELIFSQFIDHNLIQQRLSNLWQGEQGIRSMQLLQENTPVKDR